MSAPLDALLDALADEIAARVAARLPTPPPQPATEAWLTMREAAGYLGLSVKTLEEWRAQGTGPAAHKVGSRAIRYSRADLEAYARRSTTEKETPRGNEPRGANLQGVQHEPQKLRRSRRRV